MFLYPGKGGGKGRYWHQIQAGGQGLGDQGLQEDSQG